MKTQAFTKSYGTRRVLNMPPVELPEGEITAVIGANGSGKSTLARVLAGVEAADGHIVPVCTDALGYMPQKSFAFRMSVTQNLAQNGKDRARRERLMAALQIDSLARQTAKKLSGGETAKLALARLLMRRYTLLIADEPTAAMDMESTLAAEVLLQDYCRETGCAVLLITHSIQQARRIAGRVIFLHRGELLERGETESVLTAPQQEQTRRFLAFYGM